MELASPLALLMASSVARAAGLGQRSEYAPARMRPLVKPVWLGLQSRLALIRRERTAPARFEKLAGASGWVSAKAG
jgi:hypothetical protein